ncbi:MAG: flagellar basal body P-ring formation chaperone FlgA [Pseudomonadota bacterium]
MALYLRLVVVFLAMQAVSLNSARADVVRMALPVPSVTIYPGDVISTDMLLEKRFRLRRSRVPSFLRKRNTIVGMVARRTLIVGRPIARNAIRRTHVVSEGNRVPITFESAGLKITGFGKALQSGSVGEVVSVRNDDSGRIIRGTVQADGTINVGQM